MIQEASQTWEELANWWDERMGEDGDLWHRSLIDPTVMRVLGPVSGRDVLDLGCGNGYLTRRLTGLGAHATGVDASAPIVDHALRREREDPLGVTYHVADAAKLDMLGDASFDLVLCNMVLLDIADAESAISEACRVLRPEGRFVASISHPCFDVPNASGWEVERIGPDTTVWRKVSRYRQLLTEKLRWRVGTDQFSYTPAYHRPLSWYFQAFRRAGFVITALEEPEPEEEFIQTRSDGVWMAEIPLNCVFEAFKFEAKA